MQVERVPVQRAVFSRPKQHRKQALPVVALPRSEEQVGPAPQDLGVLSPGELGPQVASVGLRLCSILPHPRPFLLSSTLSGASGLFPAPHFAREEGLGLPFGLTLSASDSRGPTNLSPPQTILRPAGIQQQPGRRSPVSPQSSPDPI